MAAKGKIVIDRQRCKGCYLCLDVCPKSNLEIDPERNEQGYHPARFREEDQEDKACTGCAMCAVICPEVAIEVYRAK